jgi:hypothetical protein
MENCNTAKYVGQRECENGFIDCNIQLYYWDDKIYDGMDGKCSTHMRNEKSLS